MAGIQVYNSNNTLLLNESYINLVLNRKIQISSVGELDIVFTGEECIGAIGGDNGTIDAYCENSETKCHIIVNSLPSGGLIAYIFLKIQRQQKMVLDYKYIMKTINLFMIVRGIMEK